MRDPTSILDDLRGLGVRPGDTLMVHVSLRAIGPIDGRAETLVGVLDRAVGPSGTLMMTLGARDDWAWVNDEPEERRADLLAGSPVFDASATPAAPDVGAFAEVFRTSPGTVVSDHPEGRFGARGRLAQRFVRDVPWDHYYGPGSPLDRFVAAGGRVLRLGADDDTTTVLVEIRRRGLVLAIGPVLCWWLLGIDGLLRDGVPLVIAGVATLYGLWASRHQPRGER